MHRIRNLDIGVRLALGFGLLVGMVVVGTLFGIDRLGVLQEQQDRMSGVQWPKVRLAQRIIESADAEGFAAYQLFFAADAGERERLADELVAASDAVQEALARLEGMPLVPTERAALERLASANEEF